MAEPEDAVLPILRKIQDDIASSRRSVEARITGLEAKINDVAETVLETLGEISELNRRMTYHMGVTMKHDHRFATIEDEVKALRSRVEVLEERQ